MLEQELQFLLEESGGERAVSRFLGKHPELVRWAFCATGGHSTYVIREFPFGSRHKADFVIPMSYSGAWDVHLIELEPPSDPVVNKDGTPSRRLNKAITQIHDWSNYIQRNPVSFRRDLSDWCIKKDLLGEWISERGPCNFTSDLLSDPDTYITFYYHIVIGRREHIDKEKRRRMNYNSSSLYVRLCTYGRFVDIARNLDKLARSPEGGVWLTETQDDDA